MLFVPVGWFVFFFPPRFHLLSIHISLLRRRCPRPSQLKVIQMREKQLWTLAKESLTFRENLAGQSYQGDVQIRDWWLSKDLKLLYQTSYHTPKHRDAKRKGEGSQDFLLLSKLSAGLVVVFVFQSNSTGRKTLSLDLVHCYQFWVLNENIFMRRLTCMHIRLIWLDQIDLISNSPAP